VRRKASHSQSVAHHFSNDRKQVLATKADADKDGVTVPMTLQDYCITSKTNSSSCAASASVDVDFYDDDDDDYVDDDDDVDPDDDSGQCADCEGDSGHGDS